MILVCIILTVMDPGVALADGVSWFTGFLYFVLYFNP
jgi:hypothetical protein